MGETVYADIEGTIGVEGECRYRCTTGKVTEYRTFDELLDSLKTEEYETIVINIRSTGGNVNEAILIYEKLISSGKKVVTRCSGYVASAATIIAQAATIGCREISSNCLYLVHSSVCSAEGNSGDFARTLGLLEKTDLKVAGIYADSSGRDISSFLTLMELNNGNGIWLTAEEAIEEGLADVLISPAGAHNVKETPFMKYESMECDLLKEYIAKQNTDMMSITKLFGEFLNKVRELLKETAGGEAGHGEEEKEMDGQAVTDEKSDPTISRDKDLQVIMQCKDAEIESLRNEISILEKENAKLNALPTMTKDKEDPSVHDLRTSGNEAAYGEDIMKFRNQI